MKTRTIDRPQWPFRVNVGYEGYCEGDALSKEGEIYLTSLLDASERAKKFAAATLLSTYNEVWIDDEHGALSECGFIDNLVLSSIQILDQPDHATMYYTDGDMFGGHKIAISFDGIEPSECQLVG